MLLHVRIRELLSTKDACCTGAAGAAGAVPLPSAHGGKRGQDVPFLVMLLGQCRISIFFMCYQQMPK